MPGAALKRAGIAGVDTRAGDYPSGRGQGAWTGTRSRRPGGRPWRAAGVAAAGPARVARPSGEGMPMAGRISASHRIRNIAINTGLISFQSALQPGMAGLQGCYSVSVLQSLAALRHSPGPPQAFGLRPFPVRYRWHRPTRVASGLNFQEKSTTYSAKRVKHIIGGTKPAPTAQVQSVQVDEESAGQRLDNFLLRHLKGVPKTHVYRIIRSGEVRLKRG